MWNFVQNLILLFTTGIIIFLTCLYLYYKYAFNYWNNLGVPYPKPSFPFGNFNSQFAKYIGKQIADVYKEMKSQGHTYCGYFLFASPVFMPISPEMNKQFMVSSFSCFQDRGFYYDEVHDPMGASLITFSGEKWKKMREKLTPIFTTQKTKMMLPVVRRCALQLQELIDKTIETGHLLEIQDIIKRYTVDVICLSAFGVEGNCLKNPNAEFLRYAKMIFTTRIRDNMRLAIGQSAPFLSELFKIQLFNPTATSFFKKVVEDTIAYREKNNIKIPDILNLFIKLKNKTSIEDNDNNNEVKQDIEALTVNQIAAQCFLFFVAGFETTATTISFVLYELGLHPEIQDKVRKEIVCVLEDHDNSLTYETLADLKYLDCVVKETLRKHPTVTMLNREASNDFKIPNTNIVIKKGTKAVLSVLGLQNDPEYFPNPDKFDPERFSDENKDKIPAFAYLPFGDGPRICPGLRFGMMEIKMCLTALIPKFQFSVHPNSEIIVSCSLGNVLSTTEPILLNAERIGNKNLYF